LGTLSHAVFEQLFADDKPLPARGRIAKLVQKALDAAIREIAPFLLGAAWQVERRLLGNELGRAALAWHDVLTELGAQVLGSEVWLQGRLGDVAIHGQADALLGLTDRRLLIVDYKKSSASSRRKRMQKSYDCQANLYRVMLETGGMKAQEDTALAERLRDSAQIGIVYFTLNDAAALADTVLAESASVPGWELIDTDVSSEAMALIGARLHELRQGRLRLNRLAGVKPYALEVTPLTTLFMLGAMESLT
jgi:RecB family exonuclease